MSRGNQEKDHFAFCRKKVSLCLFLLEDKVSQPVSNKSEFIETNFVAPVTIRAASFWIFSSFFDSYCAQLFHTTSAYSNKGRII